MEQFETLARPKKRAADEQARPAKRAWRGARAELAEALRAPVVQAPVEEPTPVEGAVPGPVGAKTEEGEIPTTIETAVVVLDPKEVVPAATASAKAGQVAVVRSSLAPAEPEMERAPPTVEAREVTVRDPSAGARRSSRHQAEPGSSFQQSTHHSTWRPPNELLGGEARLVPMLLTIEDAGRAAALLSRMQTSASDEEIGRQSHAALIDIVMVNVLQLANGAFALRVAATHTGEALAQTIRRVNKYKEQARLLSMKLAQQQEEVKVREEGLSNRVKEAEHRAKVEGGRASVAEAQLALISPRLESARSRADELLCQLQFKESWTDAAADEAWVAMEKAAAVEITAVDAGHKRAGAEAHANEAGARAEEVEEKAKEAKARAREDEAGAKARIWEAEAKAEVQIWEAKAKAEAQIQEAKAKAVTDFKASAEFEQEVLKASFDAYMKGFKFCKEKVFAALNVSSSDLDKIQPGGLGEEPVEEEQDTEELGPSEP